MSLRKETWAAVAVSALLHLGAAGVLLIGGGEEDSLQPSLGGESQPALQDSGAPPTRVRLVASKMGSGYFSDAPGQKSSLTPFSARRREPGPAVGPPKPSGSGAPATTSGSAPASASGEDTDNGPTGEGELNDGTVDDEATAEGGVGEDAVGEGATGDEAKGREEASGAAPGGNAGSVAGSKESTEQGEAGGEPGGASAGLAELQRRLAVAARGCYPEQARRMRLEGTLSLKLCLDGSGAASSVAVLGGSGLAVLDRAATECVVARALPVPAVGPGCFQVPVVFGRVR